VQWATPTTMHDRTRWLELCRTMLRPAKPLLAPVVERASPFIGRLARRMSGPSR